MKSTKGVGTLEEILSILPPPPESSWDWEKRPAKEEDPDKWRRADFEFSLEPEMRNLLEEMRTQLTEPPPVKVTAQDWLNEPVVETVAHTLSENWSWSPPGPDTSAFWQGAAPKGPYPQPRRKAARGELPIDSARLEILRLVQANPILVLRGETGSGKSTQVPQFLLDAWGPDAHIVVSQPRRIAAISLAERVAAERGEDVGYSVGYHVGGQEITPWRKGSICFCTEGSLLRRLRHGADGVTHFILDEAHGRTIDLDLLFCILREIVCRHTQRSGQNGIGCGGGPRLVVMSATVELTRLVEYFQRRTTEIGHEVGTIDVPGRQFPVVAHYLEDILKTLGSSGASEATAPKNSDLPFGVWEKHNGNSHWEAGAESSVEQFVTDAVRTVDDRYIALGVAAQLLKLRLSHKAEDLSRETSCSVLFFLPGLAEIRAAAKWFSEDPAIANNCFVTELHSKAPPEAHRAVFADAPGNKLKVILATNVAETSLTIPDVDWVIDSGLMRVADHGGLRTIWEGRSNAKQRRGRAGRVRAGDYFALFSSQRHAALAEDIVPEIQRKSLTSVVLLVLEMGEVPRELLLKTLDPPKQEQLVAAEAELREMGATSESGEINGLGLILNQLPIEPHVGVALVASLAVGLHESMSLTLSVLDTSSNLCAMASSFLDDEFPHTPDSSRSTMLTSDLFSSALALARFRSFQAQEQKRDYCNEHKLAPHEMNRCSSLADQLALPLRRFAGDDVSNLDPSPSLLPLDDLMDVQYAAALLACGLGKNVAIDAGHGTLRTSSGKGKVSRDSMWLENSGLVPESGSVLLFGSMVPTRLDSKPFIICKDISRTKMIAVLIFGRRLEQKLDTHIDVDGWLRVTGLSSEDCKLIVDVNLAVQKLQATVAERLCGNRNRKLFQSVQSQLAAGDAHATRLSHWRQQFKNLVGLMWGSSPPLNKGGVLSDESMMEIPSPMVRALLSSAASREVADGRNAAAAAEQQLVGKGVRETVLARKSGDGQNATAAVEQQFAGKGIRETLMAFGMDHAPNGDEIGCTAREGKGWPGAWREPHGQVLERDGCLDGVGHAPVKKNQRNKQPPAPAPAVTPWMPTLRQPRGDLRDRCSAWDDYEGDQVGQQRWEHRDQVWKETARWG